VKHGKQMDIRLRPAGRDFGAAGENGFVFAIEQTAIFH
jgi:hypothetical protein